MYGRCVGRRSGASNARLLEGISPAPDAACGNLTERSGLIEAGKTRDIARIWISPLLVVALVVAGCGHGGTRKDMVDRLQAALHKDGLGVRLVDRRSGLVDVPVVQGCDPPLVISASREARGFATVYVCANDVDAQTALIPNGFPGRRERRGPVIIVANGDQRLAAHIARVVASVDRSS